MQEPLVVVDAVLEATRDAVAPMSPLTKLVWFREHEPKLCWRVVRWVGVQGLVVQRLTGEWVTDHSVASGTGLMDLAAPAPAMHTMSLTAAGAASLGAGDGPLANLGVGAVRPGVAACSIGTPGALRLMVERPVVDGAGRGFCYALTEDRWLVDGAINNGGTVLQWAGDALAPELGEGKLMEIAAQAPPGSDALVMLPYLLGERATHWSTLPRGAYVGLTRARRRERLVRSALEGVCQPVGFPEGPQGSGFGAALLGLEALGLVASIDPAPELVTIDEVREPGPAAAATYAAMLPIFDALHDALGPAFRQLRDLGS